jgi:hypothetical protein
MNEKISENLAQIGRKRVVENRSDTAFTPYLNEQK